MKKNLIMILVFSFYNNISASESYTFELKQGEPWLEEVKISRKSTLEGVCVPKGHKVYGDFGELRPQDCRIGWGLAGMVKYENIELLVHYAQKGDSDFGGNYPYFFKTKPAPASKDQQMQLPLVSDKVFLFPSGSKECVVLEIEKSSGNLTHNLEKGVPIKVLVRHATMDKGATSASWGSRLTLSALGLLSAYGNGFGDLSQVRGK